MAEDQAPEAQNVQAQLDDRDMKYTYANNYRIMQTAEEVILEFSYVMPNPNVAPNAQGQQQVVVRVSDRVLMNYVNTKRLVTSLQQLIKRFEQQFGEIQTTPGLRK